MSLLEELFGEDEAEEAEALERVIEGGSDEDERRGDDEAEEAEESKRIVEPGQPKSVRVVKNPRVVLNPARLTGPRGLQALPGHFKDFKFKGKGHEADDLDTVLKRLEHWAHRLYPKFQFDDCLKKIETLGKKRPVTVLLRKIRSDQIVSDEFVTQRDSSDEEAPAQPQPAPEDEEFDKLLAEQVQLARATPGGGLQTPARSLPMAPKATSSPSISDEQKQRMLRNRQMAEERRLARMRQMVPNTPPAKKFVDDTAQVVDLTDFNPAAHLVSTETNKSRNMDAEVIDMTAEPEATKRVGQVTGSINLDDDNETHKDCFTGLIDLRENTEVNENNARSNNISDSSDDNFSMAEVTSRSNKANNTENNEINTSDNEIGIHRTKELTALNYSDSSGEDCEVTNVNISVSADVHSMLRLKKMEEESMLGKDTINSSSLDAIKEKGSDHVVIDDIVKEKETETDIPCKEKGDIESVNVFSDKNDNINRDTKIIIKKASINNEIDNMDISMSDEAEFSIK